MPGLPPPGPNEGRHRRQGLDGEQAPGLLVPDLPAPSAGDRPQSGEQARVVGVDGELPGVVPLEPAVPPRDDRPAFRVQGQPDSGMAEPARSERGLGSR